MPELPERLEQLAAAATWPPTPDLAAGVRAAIASDPAPAPAPARRRRPRRPLLAALLALVVGGGVLAAPGVGSQLLERLGLRGASVTQVRELPSASGGAFALGDRHSLAGAQRLAGYALVRPAALGAPAEVYVDGGAVTFVYRSRSGRPILFTQVPGSTRRYIEKLVTRRTRRVTIAGRPGLQLRGPHVVLFDQPGGGTIVSEARLAKNTLLWERGELLLRLEAEQPADELLRIARSVG